MRVLLWKGAPIPAFRPSRGDVREMRADADAAHEDPERARLVHRRLALPPREDDRDRRPRSRSSAGSTSRSTAATRTTRRTTARAAVSAGTTPRCGSKGRPCRTSPSTSGCAGTGATGEALPPPAQPEPAGDVELQVVRTLPAGTYRARAEGRLLDPRVLHRRAAARPSSSSTSRTSSSGRPRSSTSSSTSSRDPPNDDFRVVVLLPARANDGADISRGQVAALIDADDGDERFLACTVYAREGTLRDIVYVHAKIGIVDDRWLTIGSANLNAHSLLQRHRDERRHATTTSSRARRACGSGRSTRARRRRIVADADGDVVDELWRPIADRAAPPDRAGRAAHAPPRAAAGGLAPPPARLGPLAEPASTTSESPIDARRARGDAGSCARSATRPPSRPGRRSEEPAAEGDRAEREPGPAEREPGDHVGEPVDAEHHAAAGDADRDRDRAARRAAPASAASAAGRGRARRRRRARRRWRSGRSGTTGRASPRSG